MVDDEVPRRVSAIRTGSAVVSDGRAHGRAHGRVGLVVTGAASLVVATAIGLVVMVGLGGENVVDEAWLTLMAGMREHAAWFMPIALALNRIGGGWTAAVVVPPLVIAVLLLRRRHWGALLFAVATILGALLVQVAKHAFARERPPDMIVTSDAGSFPSGHVANATVMALVLALLLARWWAWVLASLYVLTMLLSRTYLDVHWLSDTIGGAALAVGVVLLLAATGLHHRDDVAAKRPGDADAERT
ncbi:phosphatase PAP2 family protein [Litorihabitans aurantiacus]|nr:phosphatase PAP2 family protein [Litorihabitans aurantiacus]